MPPPSGGFAAVPPSSGGFVSVPPPTGQHTAVQGPSTGAQRAVAKTETVPSGEGRIAPASDQGEVDKRFGRFPTVGERFDGYTIFKLLGQGNMGKIYQARDSMNRKVAVKVILTDIANEEGLARFQREGEALAAIPRHKNIIQIHSNGTIRGMPYLTMDYVEGQTLEDVLKEQGPLPLKPAGIVIEKLARALQVAHQVGVMHRDLKPANVLIRNDNGEPVLTDFGLAGLRGAQSLTQTGDLLGTPLYMSPEQVLGMNKEVDAQTDVWGLGVLLYEMLTGAVPFPGTAMVEVCNAITSQEPLPVETLRPEVDPGLAAIVAKALCKQKRDRYRTAAELHSALKAWRKAKAKGEPLPLPPPPPSKQRTRKLVLGAVGGVMLLLVGVSALVAFKLRGGDRSVDRAEEPRSGIAPDETRPRELAMEQVVSAFERSELEEATRLLQLHADEVRGHPRLSEIRERLLSLGLGRLGDRPFVAERLNPVFRLSGVLNGLLEAPPRPEFATAVVDLAMKLERDATQRLGDPVTTQLLERLSLAGFQPSPLRFRGELEQIAWMGSKDQGPEYAKQLFSFALSLVRMQLDLQEEHVDSLTRYARPPGPLLASAGVHERYLRLRMDLHRTLLVSSNTDSVTRGKNFRRDFEALLQLIDGVDPREFGPRNFANATLYLRELDREGLRIDRLERLRGALAVDPRSLNVRMELSDCFVDEALRLAGGGDRAAGLAKAQEADGLLQEALRILEEDGYDEFGPYASLGLSLRKRAVRCAALLGDEERAKQIIHRLPMERDWYSDARGTKELEKSLQDGLKLRAERLGAGD